MRQQLSNSYKKCYTTCTMGDAARKLEFTAPHQAMEVFKDTQDSEAQELQATQMQEQALAHAKELFSSIESLPSSQAQALRLSVQEISALIKENLTLSAMERTAKWAAIADNLDDIVEATTHLVPTTPREVEVTLITEEQQGFSDQAEALVEAYKLAEEQGKIDAEHAATYDAWNEFAEQITEKPIYELKPDPLEMQQMHETTALLKSMVEVPVSMTPAEQKEPGVTVIRTKDADGSQEQVQKQEHLAGIQQALDTAATAYSAIADQLTAYEKQVYREMRERAIKESNQQGYNHKVEALRAANEARGFLHQTALTLQAREDIRGFIARGRERRSQLVPPNDLANMARKKIMEIYGIHISEFTNRAEGRRSEKRAQKVVLDENYKALMMFIRDMEPNKRNVHAPKPSIKRRILNFLR